MKLSKIKLNPDNPRVIKDGKFLKLVNSIINFPQMLEKRRLVCVTDTDKKIFPLGGNMRYKALIEISTMGRDAVLSYLSKFGKEENINILEPLFKGEIPDLWVELADEWTEEQRKEFIIKDNVSFGEWNFDELANNWEAEKLTEWGMDISTEWGKENIDENEDEIPETKEAFIKKGDLIEMNNHRLLCGDSCNDADINILMNGKQADMIFIDPPFDLEDNYSKITIAEAKKDSHVFIMNSDKLLIQNIKNNETYFRKMFYVDFKLARLVSNNRPMTRIDPIAEFCKGKTKFNNLKDAFSTLIECAQIHINNNQNYGFKQAKKVELPETFILHYSNPNELVCDFFGGAGSTLIACEKNNRICYMNEFEPLHCDIILKRWILYMKEHNKLFEVKINGEKIDVNMLETI